MHKRMPAALMIACAVFSACAAKADGPPDIHVDRTSCSHCTMLISEPRYAAAYRTDGGSSRVFDDIGCLLDALSREAKPPAMFWFMDAVDGQWVREEEAVFVLSDEIRTPMNGGVTAYDDVKSADAAAARHKGRTVRSFADLRAAKGTR